MSAWRGLLAAILLCASGATAALADARAELRHWLDAPWDGDRTAVRDWLGERGRELPGRWDFGPFYAEQAAFKVPVAGLGFTVFAQMDWTSGRLVQVLLERRQVAARPDVWERLLEALVEAYGDPQVTGVQGKLPSQESGGESRLSLAWELPAEGDQPARTVRLVWLDFMTNAIFFQDPRAPIDPKIPKIDTRRVIRNLLPRRVLIRIQPTG